jgi:PAS domain-containing protein
VLSVDGRVLDANQAARDLGELVGRPLAEASFWKQGASELADKIAVASRGYPVRCELAARALGSDATLELSIKPIEDALGPMLLVEGRDVTTQRRLVEATRSEDERLRAVLAHAPVVVFTQDKDLKYTWMANDAARFEEADEIKRRVLTTGEEARSEVKIRRGTQDVILDLVLSPTRGEDGAVTGLMGVAIDVTSQRRGEEDLDRLVRKLDEERRWLRTVIAHTPVGVILIQGTRGERIVANPRAQGLLGRPWRTEPAILRFRGAMCDPAGAPCAKRALIASRALAGETVHEEAVLVDADGQATPLVLSAAPICDADGTVHGAVVLLEDVSRLRRTTSMPPPVTPDPSARWSSSAPPDFD